MKIKFLRRAILPVLSLIVLISCNNDRPSIVGKWAPINVDKKYIEMNHATEERLKELYQNEKAEFTKDGKFIAPSKEDTAHGTYIYDDTQKKLSIIIEHEEKPMDFTVQFSGNNQVSLTSENGTIIFKRE